MHIEDYTNGYQREVEDFVVGIHKEFGFPYNFILDYDLENPDKFYSQVGGIFYLLLNREQVIGTVAVRKINDKFAEIKRMYLLPEYRGLGWGTQLLEKVLAFCREKGFKTCILDTNVTQEAAQKLYAKYGFEVYKKDGSTLFMHKSLN